MTILNPYSWRKRVSQGEVPDVYSYDDLPRELLVQIIHIWKKAIGPYYKHDPYDTSYPAENNKGWLLIEELVANEHGLPHLSTNSLPNAFRRCENYLLNNPSTDKALDLIEVSFSYIDGICRHFNEQDKNARGIRLSASDAIIELNERFRRSGIGSKAGRSCE